MERKIYQPTAKQQSLPLSYAIPTNEECKMMAKRQHRPWGLIKRDYTLNALRRTHDYTIGMWQGRVDAANGLEYCDERFSETYNVGYHEGYLGYQANGQCGWDRAMQERFTAQYVNN